METQKQCRKCERTLNLTSFSKHSGTRDKLDNRCKDCVKQVKKNPDRERRPTEPDVCDTDTGSRVWQGGKKRGCIINEGEGLFLARVGNKACKSLHLKNFEMDEGKLREEAHRFLYTKSLELGLTTNRYKIIFNKTDEPVYLIVQLSKNFITLCDYDMLPIVRAHPLFVTITGTQNAHNKHYAGLLKDDRNVPFHKFITGYEMTDHIDRYPMDNRRCNLRKTSHAENNRNRTNYSDTSLMTGVGFSVRHEAWCGRIKVDNKLHNKGFPVSVHGYEGAKQKAIEWRQQMALEHDNYNSKHEEMNVHRHPDYDRLKREYEEIMLEHADGFVWKEE